MSADLAIRLVISVLLIASVPAILLSDSVPAWAIMIILGASAAYSFWFRPLLHAHELRRWCRTMANRPDVLVLGAVTAGAQSRPVCFEMNVIDTTGACRFHRSYRPPKTIGPADGAEEEEAIGSLAELLGSADTVLAGKEAGRFVRRVLCATAERNRPGIDQGIRWQAMPEDLPHWHAENSDLPPRFPTALDPTNAWSILTALRAMSMWTLRPRAA